MATASAPKASRPAERGTTTPARPTAALKVTPVPVPKPGSIPSLPPSANHAAAVARASNSNATSASAPQAGFGRLNSAESNVQDAAGSAHRDGRVRNPVPSKLKGKTDGSKGNFSVLHMDVAGRSEATERDAQAKRTSESTELAAKRAFENGYVSLRRNAGRFVHLPDETPPPKPFVPAPASAPTAAANPLSVPANAPASSLSSRRLPLNSEETKAEQARLLTLLRSLHPVLVVDQICTALAFFGGIPGAPPPADDAFPQSAEANGSGRLFIGWIAEIFPKLGGKSNQQQPSPVRQLETSEAVRRRRGRPKGSKATKARKDKGIKKGPIKASSGVQQPQPVGGADESWVDVDDDGVDVPNHVDANVMLLAQAASPQQPQVQEQTQQQTGQAVSTPSRTALPGPSASSGPTPNAISSIKRRGRPKGSKNRPKEPISASSDTVSTASRNFQDIQDTHTPYGSSRGPQIPPTAHNSVANPSFTAVNSSSETATPAKKKAIRSKGPGNKSKTVKQPIESSGGPTITTAPLNTHPLTQTQSEPDPVNQVSSTQTYQSTQRIQPPGRLNMPLPTPPEPSASHTAGTSTQKRKRKPAKDPDASRVGTNGGNNAAAPPTHVNGLTLPTPSITQDQQALATASTSGPPPPKRPRKSQEPKSSVRKQNEAAATGGGKRQTPTSLGISSPSSAPNPGPAPVPGPVPAQVANAGADSRLGSGHVPVPISVESTMAAISSPQHGQFEAQSPTIENYEAQLQAQLEQQTETEPQTLSTQSRLDPRHLMASHLHQHQQQQQKHHLQQRQQVQQQAQPQGPQQQPSASQSRSPNPPPQPIKSQTGSPISAQQPVRSSHSQSYSQYRPTNAQYSQQQQEQEHHKPQQQQQQSYSSTQHQQSQHQHQQQQHQQQQHQQQQHQQQQHQQQQHQQQQHQQQQHQQQQQHFSTQQQATPVSAQSQQYPTNSQQTPQYTSSQQPYQANHQYSSGQQQVASQRYQQQLGTSSAGTASYTAHQSPQFGASTSNAFNSTDTNNYRASVTNLNNSSYVPQRSQSATPSTTAAYRTIPTHGLPQLSPSFSPSTGPGQHRSATSSHPTGQGIQGMAGVSSFAGSTGADWNLFDTGNLDTAGNQGALGLNNAGYSMNQASVRAPQNAGTTFPPNPLANFDASSLGGGDRYYGVGRR
ncbi:hypothetical protein B0H66DRAFT_53383 [Apodospora peruviana]|uniref:Uncharacterized protein n=1 Tax=Apodospora peruviana TaxID=516989 RepID=A0AAE0IS34_9PEZI|nr:hypothetical protein B0H66DRAFT_53383 [Apodospora peruviana]